MGLVVGRVATVEGAREPVELTRCAAHADRARRRSGGAVAHIVVGAQPVLLEVVEQRQARVGVDGRALRRRERVVVVDAVGGLGELVVLTGHQRLATLVEVVAHRELEVERELGRRACGLARWHG